MRTLSLVLLGMMGLGLTGSPVLASITACDGPVESAADVANFPAGTFFTVDTSNRLERFNVATPGTRLGSVAITGLDPGEQILGIDFRPQTGQFYGLGSTSQLYLINPVTGAAKPVRINFTPALSGTEFGFDFNPAVDRIRVVSNTGQNLRLNADTGQVAAVDGAINPGGTIVGSAYINNFGGTTTTLLYGLDASGNQLVTQAPPNSGTVNVVGALGVDFDDAAGFDIAAGTNAAFAVLSVGGPPSNLYSIDLTTGVATLVGAIGTTNPVRAMALATSPETVFGVTMNNNLVCFKSSAPGTILDTRAITGLQGGENLLGIDFRPATAELFGLGSTSRLYRIDTATAVATPVGAGPFTPALSGTDFGFDFNPTVDRVRIVSDAEQNLRAHPITGAISGTDVALNPAGNVVAAAYTNNFAGTVSTTLYDIDSSSDQLLIQNPPNNGTLTPVGSLGIDVAGETGFDITPRGTAYLSTTLPAGTASMFYSVNLTTGAALLIGTVGGSELLRDTAVRLFTEIAYGVTATAGPTNNLIRFNAAAPGAILSSVPITGLQTGETVLGIDFRPSTGQLFALGSTSRLYTLNPATGAATQVGTAPFAVVLSGASFGFDFNPTVDRIRVNSDAEQNFRLDPVTGALASSDGVLNPAGNVVAAAYINNYAFPATTTLFDIDSVASNLVVQNPPNTGTLVPVGPLGIAVSNGDLGFDIASTSGTAYATAYTGAINPGLYRVNLSTGAATLVGSIATTDPLVAFSIQLEPLLRIFSDGFE